MQCDTNVPIVSSRVSAAPYCEINQKSDFDVNLKISSLFNENFNPCEYFDVNCIPNSDPEKSLFLLHLNIRFLQKHFDNLSEFLCMLPDQPHNICLSETRIFNEPKINVSLPEYSFCFSNSITHAGGVGIFVTNSFHHKEVSSYNLNLTTCENEWISVTCPFTQTEFVIGCICRHPSSKLQPFCDCLSDSLANLNEANKKYFILGDIDIDLPSDTISDSYKNILAEYGVVALINKPTRITSTSATTLDHILTNTFRYQLFPGIINYDLTDHSPVYVEVSCCIKTSSSCKKPVRSFANFNPEQFREDLLANMQIFYNQFQNIPENCNEN